MAILPHGAHHQRASELRLFSPDVSAIQYRPNVDVFVSDVSFLLPLRIISDLGYGDTKALLLACPPYLCAALASIAVACSSGWFHERTWHLTAGLALEVAGFVAAAATMNPTGRYVACFIFPAGGYMIPPLIISWMAATLSQSPEKKAVSLQFKVPRVHRVPWHGPVEKRPPC